MKRLENLFEARKLLVPDASLHDCVQQHVKEQTSSYHAIKTSLSRGEAQHLLMKMKQLPAVRWPPLPSLRAMDEFPRALAACQESLLRLHGIEVIQQHLGQLCLSNLFAEVRDL